MPGLLLGILLGASLDGAPEAVAKGDFTGAESAYRAALDAGNTSADLYYNLGNVIYRQQRVAEAILAWRRAGVLAPRDPDVQANLQFARRGVIDDVVVPDPVPAWAPWQAALTANEAQWLGAWLAGLGLLGVAFRRRTAAVPLAALGATAVAVGMVLAIGGVASARLPPAAVVLAAEGPGRSDLGGGVDLFVLHAGAEVGVADEAAGQVLVVLPDGRRGWVAGTALGRVDPRAGFPSGVPSVTP